MDDSKKNLLSIKQIEKNEWKFAFFIGLVCVVITSIPFFSGHFYAPSDKIYNSILAFIPGDFPVYYSYIHQVIDGQYLLENKFTTEPQFLHTFNIWWLLVGLVGKIFLLSPMVVFQISRILMIIIFSFVSYYFFSHFFKSILKRKLAHFFLFFSSGLGFYFFPFINILDEKHIAYLNWPIDLWQPEAITFSSLWLSSHLIASVGFTMILMLLIYYGLKNLNLKTAFLAGFLGLVYFNFHPYYIPSIYGVLFFYWLYLIWQQKKIIGKQIVWSLVFILISSLSIYYHFWLIFSDFAIAQRATQNISTMPPWTSILIGYGFLLIGFSGGLWYRIFHKSITSKHIFLLIWLAVNILLLLLPTQFSRRYVHGLHIIFVLFTIDYLFYLYNLVKEKIPNFYQKFINKNYLLFGLLFLFIFGMSNSFNLFRSIYYQVEKPGNFEKMFFLEKGLIDVYQWVNKQPRGKVILSGDLAAIFTPGFSGQKVYVGHNHETLFYESKKKQMLYFFASDDNSLDDYKKNFLHREKIDYVIYSPYEKELGDFQPQQKDYLQPVFASGQTTIYQVTP